MDYNMTDCMALMARVIERMLLEVGGDPRSESEVSAFLRGIDINTKLTHIVTETLDTE